MSFSIHLRKLVLIRSAWRAYCSSYTVKNWIVCFDLERILVDAYCAFIVYGLCRIGWSFVLIRRRFLLTRLYSNCDLRNIKLICVVSEQISFGAIRIILTLSLDFRMRNSVEQSSIHLLHAKISRLLHQIHTKSFSCETVRYRMGK